MYTVVAVIYIGGWLVVVLTYGGWRVGALNGVGPSSRPLGRQWWGSGGCVVQASAVMGRGLDLAPWQHGVLVACVC